MAATPKVIQAILQYVGGTAATWSDVTTPLPNGIFVIDTDNGDIRRGDGAKLYSQLPVLLNTNEFVNHMQTLNNKADIGHTHVPNDVTGLQTALNNKSDANHTHTFQSIAGYALDSNNTPNTVALRDAGGGLTGQGVNVTSAAPMLAWYETDASADSKRWHVQAQGGVLYYAVGSDDGSQGTAYLSVTRGGATPTTATWLVPVTTSRSTSIGTTVASEVLFDTKIGIANANNDRLVTRTYRLSAGTDWNGVAWELMRQVDGTKSAFMRLGGDTTDPNAILFGANATTRFQIASSGNSKVDTGLTSFTGGLNLTSASGYLGIHNAAPAAELDILATGGDNDVRIALRANGSIYSQIGRSATQTFIDTVNTDPFLITTGSATQFRVATVAGAANYLQTGAASAGTFPTLGAAGSDTNIGLALLTKGSGNFVFQSAGTINQFGIAHTAAATRYASVTGATSTTDPTFSTNAGGIKFATAARGTLVTLTPASGVFTINCDLGNEFDAGTLTQNVTFANPTNLPPAGSAQGFTVLTKQDATGGRAIAVGSNWVAVGNTKVSTGANKYNVIAGTVYPTGVVTYAIAAGA